MNFIADLHIHSKYSRATAKNLDFENLYIAAQIKGITVVGSGDFTHPAWWQEITEKLVPAEEGLFQLRPEIASACDEQVPPSCRRPVRFMLVTEISNIYKKNDRTRKNHNLVFMPDRDTAERFNTRLDKIGNIRSDGRPILGLDARNLLELVLEISDSGYLVPAHIWTPWFSLLGSKSGFDRVDDCFEDLSGHIFAVETGLSSDPPMNWRVSDLDRFTLISNSDAHSPAKLGREANLFDTDLSYGAIHQALKHPDNGHFSGTIEFFPEEGKYHVDGHRKCNFRCSPTESRALNNLCPVCGKPLVQGVLFRVEELADRPEGERPCRALPFQSLIPLTEVLAEVFQTGVGTQRVQRAYDKLIRQHGSEFEILRQVPEEGLDRNGVPLLAEAIGRMRRGKVIFDPGYDGEYGRVRIFDPRERGALMGQQSLFDVPAVDIRRQQVETARPVSDAPKPPIARAVLPDAPPVDGTIELNAEQQMVVNHIHGPLLIAAGPGTGKTRTITARMVTLISERGVQPDAVLAVTFTNKAAMEMRQRLAAALGSDRPLPFIATFHGMCRQLLLEKAPREGLAIVDDDTRRAILADVLDQVKPGQDARPLSPGKALAFIVAAKQRLLAPGDDLSVLQDDPAAPALAGADPVYLAALYYTYQQMLKWQGLYDFEDLILETVRSLETDPAWRDRLQQRFAHIFVDEFQDINFGQYRLIRLLAPDNADICAIGDPDQAIYGFRGSDVRFFSQFAEDYHGVRLVRLTRNYRSTETILEASFQVIQQQPSCLGAARTRAYSTLTGEKTITLLEAPSARAEAVAIGRTIEEMVGGAGFHAIDFGKVGEGLHERSFSDFAVLFRTSEQGALIAEVLRQAGLPCQFADRQQLKAHKAIAKLLALLRVIADQGNFTDFVHLTDLIAPGISSETLAGFKRWAYANRMVLVQSMNTVLRLPIPLLSTARQQRLAALVRFIHALKNECRDLPVAEAIRICVSRTTINNHIPDEDLNTLLAQGDHYGADLVGFLAGQTLQNDTDLYQPGVEKVTLMTMHAAKGLEFNVVFVAGCEQGLIPFTHPGLKRDDPDEERRLFFVAMTRARQQLFLTWARRRNLYGKTVDQRISPFVADIEQRLKDGHQTPRKKPVQQQLSLF